MTVEIQVGGRSYRVATAADVERVLDLLTRTLTGPTLVRLQAPETVLHIGVGDASASVALFLDAGGCPLFADGTGTGRPEPEAVAFDQDGVTRQFHRRGIITPSEARNAAVEFVTGDGARPTRLRWIAEGRRSGTG